MMSEARLRIRLEWDGQRICRVQVAPRPLVRINTLLRGKRADEALRMIPMVFSLCGKAQAAAAATALDAAAQVTPSALLSRERRVLAEALQESLWRFLLDLPRLLHTLPQAVLLAALRRQLADCITMSEETEWQAAIAALDATVARALLGPADATISALDDPDRLGRVLATADTATTRLIAACRGGDAGVRRGRVPLMPLVSRQDILSELEPSLRNNSGFPLRPYWHGNPAETGSLARMQHHPLIARLLAEQGPSIYLRLVARLAEIGELISRLRAPDLPEDSFVQGATCGPHAGIGWVQNARGLLLHRVVLDKHGTIEDYCLVAPTEWNFHPEGAILHGLAGAHATTAAQARQHAELLAHSLDPCVAHEIEVDHA